MSLSFACPNCRALIQVGDELAGQTGKCPRCERLLIIPTNSQPMPILLDEEGHPVPIKVEPRREPDAVVKPLPPIEEAPRRARRGRPFESSKPSGPRWPWVLGILSALIVFAVLTSSFVTLCAYRPREPAPNVTIFDPPPRAIIPPMEPGIRPAGVGQLQGQRILLANGVFKLDSGLTLNDMIDPLPAAQGQYRCKRFEVELIRDRDYLIAMTSQLFDGYVRVEDLNGQVLGSNGVKGNRGAVLSFRPIRTDTFVVIASNVDPGILGEFTLTIRESHLPRP